MNKNMKTIDFKKVDALKVVTNTAAQYMLDIERKAMFCEIYKNQHKQKKED